VAQLGYDVPDDVDKAVDTAESLVFRIAERRITDTMMPIHTLMDLGIDRLEQLYENKGEITGLQTGFRDLDNMLGGFQPSSLVIIGAVVAYIMLADLLGFLIVAPLCLVACFLAFRVKLSHAVLWALAGTLVVHVTFYKLLRVPLPWGVLRPLY